MKPTFVNKVTPAQWKLLYPVMYTMAHNLEEAFRDKTGVLDALSEEDKLDLLFHIMAKGEDMYYGAIVDPGFCLHMVDKYQPLHTMIRKRMG
jgi:hypothetical protein